MLIETFACLVMSSGGVKCNPLKLECEGAFMSGHGTIVLGSATTTTAAVILPNTGSNNLLAIVAAVTMVAGIAITVTSVARVVVKRSFKA